VRSEISSQNATVDRLKAELANPEAEKKRNQELSETGAISASAYDTKRLAVGCIWCKANISVWAIA
jgi:HlyD family secretion protein